MDNLMIVSVQATYVTSDGEALVLDVTADYVRGQHAMAVMETVDVGGSYVRAYQKRANVDIRNIVSRRADTLLAPNSIHT